MDKKNISPIRAKTPNFQSSCEQIGVLKTKRVNVETVKSREVQAIKEELRNNKVLIQKKKEEELRIAKEKVRMVKVKKNVGRLSNSEVSQRTLMKNNLNSHIEWMFELEKKV